MQIGFLIPDYEPAMVDFAGKAGFDCLELFTVPGGTFDLNTAAEDDLKRIRDHFAAANVRIGTFACSVNHFDPKGHEENQRYFIKAIRTCRSMGTDILCTNAWGDPGKTPAENVALYKEVFSEYARIAEDEGVKIAMENCPHSNGYPIRIGNIAHSPEMWEVLFSEVPSGAIGLEFDPSHLFWQQIDIEKAIRGFGDRIYSFHAKDTEIVHEQMARCGIYGNMFGKTSIWDYGVWRYRIPGWGDINWKGLFRALNDVAYKGPIIIEHEDPVFMGERQEEGLSLGLRFLRGFAL